MEVEMLPITTSASPLSNPTYTPPRSSIQVSSHPPSVSYNPRSINNFMDEKEEEKASQSRTPIISLPGSRPIRPPQVRVGPVHRQVMDAFYALPLDDHSRSTEVLFNREHHIIDIPNANLTTCGHNVDGFCVSCFNESHNNIEESDRVYRSTGGSGPYQSDDSDNYELLDNMRDRKYIGKTRFYKTGLPKFFGVKSGYYNSDGSYVKHFGFDYMPNISYNTLVVEVPESLVHELVSFWVNKERSYANFVVCTFKCERLLKEMSMRGNLYRHCIEYAPWVSFALSESEQRAVQVAVKGNYSIFNYLTLTFILFSVFDYMAHNYTIILPILLLVLLIFISDDMTTRHFHKFQLSFLRMRAGLTCLFLGVRLAVFLLLWSASIVTQMDYTFQLQSTQWNGEEATTLGWWLSFIIVFIIILVKCYNDYKVSVVLFFDRNSDNRQHLARGSLNHVNISHVLGPVSDPLLPRLLLRRFGFNPQVHQIALTHYYLSVSIIKLAVEMGIFYLVLPYWLSLLCFAFSRYVNRKIPSFLLYLGITPINAQFY